MRQGSAGPPPARYVELEPGQPFGTWTPAQVRAYGVRGRIWHDGRVWSWADALAAGLVGPGPVPAGRQDMTETRRGRRG